MSAREQDSKRVEEWLTRGRPRIIRTRGAVRVRGTPVPAVGVEIGQVKEVAELLQRLEEDVPEAPWVIVIDGEVDAFAKEACLQAKEARKDSRFWVIGSKRETSAAERELAELNALWLNPQDADDLRFLENLVADLVIVPPEPEVSIEERLQRWLSHTRYVLAERLDDSLIRKLQTSLMGAVAEVFVIKRGK